VKVKHKILYITLLLLVLPSAWSCNVQPPDKWPTIVGTDVTADLDVHYTIDALGIVTVNVPDPTITIKVDVRTYNMNQGFKITTIMQNASNEFVVIAPEGIYSGAGSSTDFNQTWVGENMSGTYVQDSGEPPQGTTEITYTIMPDRLPTLYQDWFATVNGSPMQVTRYVFHFIVLIQDAGGRSDTFDFELQSKLVAG
jgi:hypothetical protein